ncbi:uncharacterized protein CTRU02_204061 [Colletotrichum truncatum]|uniref:Uncharacterized protein n=1 Tax=Colletotrichum truncatum TaxID=5467 RepID=A0ACC3ZBL1_COLTU|nr:uncharacterized protein CTRU02_13656 [Colletotrichum truncatum]KAF6783189.1 hypothetical protein CTRU02_13656 [Colletotrichum truncatum]
MSTKRDSGDWTSQRRLYSVRERLSGFVRRGAGLAKKTTTSMIGEPRHERESVDESPKAFPRVQVQDFGTSSLEIDLQSLEAFRTEPRSEKKVEHPKPPTASSTTPIADMFARKATTIAPPTVTKTSLNKSSPSLISSPVDKPSKKVPAEGRQPSIAPSHKTHAPSPAANVTIISSGYAQPHIPKPWPPPEPARVVEPIRIQLSTTSEVKQPSRVQLREPRRGALVSSGPAPITTPEPINRPRRKAIAEKQLLPQNAEKRHSTPTTVHSLTTVPKSLPVETLQTDRRRSWQPAQTSVPSGPSTPSAPPSASAPWRDFPNRRVSTRLGTDRLRWIRELEEGKKNKSTINGDLPVLKTMQGSVADKLARFESKQQQQQLAPIARSNSTRSRTSSIADTFTSYGAVTTTRSSLDSHRTSSVFSHYDDSFREKMELITGNANRKAEDANEEKPALIRVTSTFVSVEKRNKKACIGKPMEV